MEQNQEEFAIRLDSLTNNQSILHDNLTSISSSIETLNIQVLALNASISKALLALANAPQLKDVPGKINSMSQELGQFGSRLTGIESQLQTAKGDLVQVQNSLKSVSNLSHNEPKSELFDKVNKIASIFVKKS